MLEAHRNLTAAFTHVRNLVFKQCNASRSDYCEMDVGMLKVFEQASKALVFGGLVCEQLAAVCVKRPTSCTVCVTYVAQIKQVMPAVKTEVLAVAAHYCKTAGSGCYPSFEFVIDKAYNIIDQLVKEPQTFCKNVMQCGDNDEELPCCGEEL